MRRSIEALVVVATGVLGILMLAVAFWFIENVLGYEPDALIQTLLALVGLIAGSSFGALYVRQQRSNGDD
jgi:thiol:disulfide interchange protein